jgi:ABC-type enterochelin transport system ATPase subunit
MNAVHTTVSAAAVPLSALLGSKMGIYLSTASPSLPDWLTPLLGPAGALIGTLLAIRWLLARLDRVEAKAEKRDAERDANMTLICTIAVQNQEVIEQNSSTLQDVKAVIQKCSGRS